MNIKDLKSSLEYCFKAEVTPFIWGRAGIGKSTVIKQYAADKGYKFFPFYLGTQSDLGDILGLAEFVDNGDGSKSTSFAIPKWLHDTVQYCNANPDSGAIIFLDEFNRARRDILNGMFSLALDKSFHTLKLPKNCHIVAAGNPPTDEYSVTDVDDTALMARFAHIKLEPSFNEWTQYAEAAQFESTLVSFLKEQPELLEDNHSSFTLPVKVDRRAYERINRLFKVGTPMNLLEQLMIGIIGAERLVAYKLHLTKQEKPLTAVQVLSGEGIDLITDWSNPIDVKSSLISITCDNVFNIFSSNTSITELDSVEADNFMAFLAIIPKEMAYALLRKCLNANSRAFKVFMQDPIYEPKLVALVKEAKGVGVPEVAA